MCSPVDSLSQSNNINLKDLSNKNYFTFIKEIPTRNAIDGFLKRENVIVNIKQEFDNIETLKRSIELGTGVSILPKNAILHEVKNKSLNSIPLDEGVYFRTTGIITRKDRPLSKATREIIRWITDNR